LTKLVSIIIDNYNYQDYVSAAIQSALSQTYQPCEVIVVDDGSTDLSRSAIESFGDKIRSVFKPNGGQASAFNAGYAASKGDILCFLDSDDLFLPSKVSRVVTALDDSRREWCFHHQNWVDQGLEPVEMPADPSSTGEYDLRDQVSHGGGSYIPPATSGLSFTRNLLEQIMPIPETIRITADNYLKLPAMLLAPGFYISDGLTLQMLHLNNFYTRNKGSLNRANVEFSVACGLDSKFPQLREHCDRMFVGGAALSLMGDKITPEIAKLRSAYFHRRTPTQKLSIATRVAYRVVRGMSQKLIGQGR
jgi:glycosyltransferase involved in cell wall biosynthesis